MSELKPCPLKIECRHSDYSEDASGYTVLRFNGECVGRCERETAEKLIAAWNTRPPTAVEQDLESEFRRIMWLSHGHHDIYGDDGEMQCGECRQYGCWDYKRAPLDEVRGAYSTAILARGQVVQNPTAVEKAAEEMAKALKIANAHAPCDLYRDALLHYEQTKEGK